MPEKTLWVHTGTIDACWGMMKDSILDELPTCTEGESRLNDLVLCARVAVEMGKQSPWTSSVEENGSLLSEDVASPEKCAPVVSQQTTHENERFFECRIYKVNRKTRVKLQIAM